MRTTLNRTSPKTQSATVLLTACLVLLVGCTTGLRNKQLEKVAKDWSLVIRASQVIPIYPLSEDLQPGDVLLVSTPIEEQVSIYKQKGFLPLDQHLVRLYSDDFPNFYKNRYGIKDNIIPPAHWQTAEVDQSHNWKIAPHAAFPTYQFKVRTGAGLNLAIPIQGVPFALGLMNSGSASGTVTIADAYTYGLDNYNMERLVRGWGNKHRLLLSNYEPQDEKYHFLRVISRVYVTGRVSVTVNNDESTSAEAGAGADRPVNLLSVEEGNTRENFNKAMATINTLAKDQLPGAKVKIATASSRSVTLSEEFDRPLIIGYIGFDLPILTGGRLGPAISTLAQLTERTILPANAGENVYRLAALSHMYEALTEIQGTHAETVRGNLDALDRLLPAQYPFTLYELDSPTEIRKSTEVVAGKAVARNGFRSIVDFIGLAQTTMETLRDHRDAPQLKMEYEAAKSAIKNISDAINQEPVLMDAIDFVFFGT